MITLQNVMEMMIILAAFIYCAKEIESILSDVSNRKIENRMESIAKLEKEAYKEIQTDFDFWWEGEPQKAVIRNFIDTNSIPREVVELIPEAVLEAAAGQVVAACKDAALHLAIHAHMNVAQQKIVDGLPKRGGLRDRVRASMDDHKNDLATERLALLESGVDVDELEKMFSK